MSAGQCSSSPARRSFADGGLLKDMPCSFLAAAIQISLATIPPPKPQPPIIFLFLRHKHWVLGISSEEESRKSKWTQLAGWGFERNLFLN
eukprot:3322190-Rhodomonas_salina.1